MKVLIITHDAFWPFRGACSIRVFHVARKLLEAGHEVLAFGDENDAARYRDGAWPKGVQSHQGSLGLLESAAALQQMDAVVANDCGLAHMAAALGVPVVCLWGPTSLLKGAPLGENVVNLSLEMSCAPCHLTERWQTCSNNLCLSSLSVENVLAAVRDFTT